MIRTERNLSKYLLILSVLIVSLFTGFKISDFNSFNTEGAVPNYSKIPDDTPLDAVKWTGGFWQDRMERLRNIYLPGVLDGSYMDTGNGSSLRNFLRAAGIEQGTPLGENWSDGDCFFLIDALSRLYAYKHDSYLKEKLGYWIQVFSSIQRPDGLLDSWTTLGKEGSNFQYNFGHLYKSANTHYRSTSETTMVSMADSYCSYYANSTIGVTQQVAYAFGLRYARTGETVYFDKLKNYYSATKTGSAFGPPFRIAEEIYGHNTAVFHELNGATLLYELTGETALLEALKRLTQNLLSKKVYITGAVAGLNMGLRPEITINNKTYPGATIIEAVGQPYDLPLDRAYCESCGQGLFMEFLYRMFRLTGNPSYMDAAERMLYNTTLGTVALEQPYFFYANPQRQGSDSWRRPTSGIPDHWTQKKYTWKREYLAEAACCRPKILRAIAMSSEIAYNVNNEGLWVNLYGNNTLRIKLPWGDSLNCRQSTNYPWDGKIKLDFNKVEDQDPFSVFLRIPEWADTLVTVKLNGEILTEAATPGTYHRLHRKWSDKDHLEFELPMKVRFMAADDRIADDCGKVAVMRGPIVYCLEDQDIPSGNNIELFYITGDTKFSPVSTNELGGITKLTGSLVYTPQYKYFEPYNTWKDKIPEKGLYQKTNLPDSIIPETSAQTVQVNLIPFYTRLNRNGNYFKTWIPVYNVSSGTGVTLTEDSDLIVLYPNPVSGCLFVSVKDQPDIISFRIYNFRGELMQNIRNPDFSNGIPTEKLSPGFYMTESEFRNHRVIRKTFIKI